jgi:arginyl-tRNA synthetase
MADPVATLAPRFEAALRAAFGDELAAVDPQIRRSDRADLQSDVALGLAKRLKRPPRDVAAALLEKLDLAGVCEKVEIAGAGFLNLTLDPAWLAAEVSAVARDARLGVSTASSPEVVVIDYSAPNVAKEMHVGHLRSTIIGDALARTLEHVGHKVIRQNHVGDWGTQFGMLIEALIDADKGAETLSVGGLDAFYKAARARFDAEPEFAQRARQRVVLLQAGDAFTLTAWRTIVDASRAYFQKAYAQLDVTLRDEDVCGESFYNSRLAPVVAELAQKGLARESEGALCVFPKGFIGKDDKPLPLIARKQDGGYGYATTDLAAIRYRTQELRATRLLYVVGTPQQQHLAMIFEAAREAGWLVAPARAEHVAFGSVLGADKKMFKTRSGETVRLADLLDEAVARADSVIAAKNPELDGATRAEVAKAVGVGGVKYADLSSDRIKDYVFDFERMLAAEGNTGPYLQYAHARIRSIGRKAAEGEGPGAIALVEPAERALALEVLGFDAAVAAVASTLQPHKLCTYLFGLATRFSTFYEKCPVVRAEDPAVRASRLALVDVTARTLAKGLELLGIRAPAAM